MQFLIYCLAYPLIWFISILPFRLLYMFSDVVFFFVYHVFGYRKKVVNDHLTMVFPEKSDAEIKTITLKFYHHFCDMLVEALKSLSITEKEMNERFKFTNIEEIRQYEKLNKSIMLMCGHYGSWEWIFILQKHVSHKGYAVYKKLQNPYFDALIKRIRAKYNSDLITTREAYHILNETTKRGELTINGFVADQTPTMGSARYWGEFLGVKVPIHIGAEVLAKKLDMAVVFFAVKRIKRGYYETTFHTITKDPNSFPDYQITDEYMKLVEKQIYEAPEYYLWTHKRWKHRDKVPVEFQ